jgi:EAL domain-containing protein (putative c-di-GMP-specific phosphodiesterase class I)
MRVSAVLSNCSAYPDSGWIGGQDSFVAETGPANDGAAARPAWPAGMTSGRRRPVPAEPPVPLAELEAVLAGAGVRNRYQPVVRFGDRLPVGLEVLARLEHPGRGLLTADQFVPQFEDAGLLWGMTQAVVGQAFADWGSCHLDLLGLSLALNFPLDLLLLPAAIVWLDEQRQAAGIPAADLVIELTESQPVTRIDDLREAVAWLRRTGYGVAIDDVGPGVRDHRMLLDLDFSMLKLDKDLVRESGEAPAAKEFLLRAVAAARAARLQLVAEGIEDAEMWDRMEGLGVDAAQGYLIAQPMSAEAVPAWHHAWCAHHLASGPSQSIQPTVDPV